MIKKIIIKIFLYIFYKRMKFDLIFLSKHSYDKNNKKLRDAYNGVFF